MLDCFNSFENRSQLEKIIKSLKEHEKTRKAINIPDYLEFTENDVDLIKLAYEKTGSTSVKKLTDFIIKYNQEKVWICSFDVNIEYKNKRKIENAIYKIFEENEDKLRLKELNSDCIDGENLKPTDLIFIEVYFKAQGFASTNEILRKFHKISCFIKTDSIYCD